LSLLLDPFRKTEDSHQSIWDKVFSNPGAGRGGSGGGGYRRSKEDKADQELEAEAEEAFIKDDIVQETPPKPKPAVRLSNPEWQGVQGFYNEKMKVTVEGEIPPESSHLTKVSFTVHAILPNGKLDRIDAQEAHIRDGRATAELTLWIPNYRDEDGKTLDKCEYAFKAKHRDSQEIESGPLKGGPKSGAATSSYYLRIHMNPELAKKLEEKFILIGSDGSFTQTRTSEDDLILGDDFIDLRFTEVPIDLAFSLRIETNKSQPYHVFKDVPFARLDGWAG
jgi:hypothetical protein